MANENRFYLTASELSDLMGISIGHAYKLIRNMNAELAKEGYIVVAGKVPKRYVEKRCYGYTLGHEDIKTTLNTYGHLYPNTDQKMAEQLESEYREEMR